MEYVRAQPEHEQKNVEIAPDQISLHRDYSPAFIAAPRQRKYIANRTNVTLIARFASRRKNLIRWIRRTLSVRSRKGS